MLYTTKRPTSSVIGQGRIDPRGRTPCENHLGTSHFEFCFWPDLRGFRLPWLWAMRAITSNVTGPTINAVKADIQAMGEGEARTTASSELQAAQEMMAKNDIEGC